MDNCTIDSTACHSGRPDVPCDNRPVSLAGHQAAERRLIVDSFLDSDRSVLRVPVIFGTEVSFHVCVMMWGVSGTQAHQSARGWLLWPPETYPEFPPCVSHAAGTGPLTCTRQRYSRPAVHLDYSADHPTDDITAPGISWINQHLGQPSQAWQHISCCPFLPSNSSYAAQETLLPLICEDRPSSLSSLCHRRVQSSPFRPSSVK